MAVHYSFHTGCSGSPLEFSLLVVASIRLSALMPVVMTADTGNFS